MSACRSMTSQSRPSGSGQPQPFSSAPIKAIQTSGTVSPEQSFMAAAANGREGGKATFKLAHYPSPGPERTIANLSLRAHRCLSGAKSSVALTSFDASIGYGRRHGDNEKQCDGEIRWARRNRLPQNGPDDLSWAF